VNTKNKDLYREAAAVLNTESPITLRGLMYRLVSAGHLPDTSHKSYSRLGRLMTWARETGHVPMSMIVDHIRATLKPSSWSGLSDFGDTVRDAYRKNFWASLDCHVAVFCEKDAIAGTIQPATEKYDVPLHVCRGYASISFAGSIAEQWKRIEKPIYAYYLGDFDPSGFDIERDLIEKLARYSERQVVTAARHNNTNRFHWRRLGVTDDDFADFGLIELAVKLKDNRAKAFIRDHGGRCAEIDALPPSELRQRIEDAISEHIDSEKWSKLQATEELEKATIKQTLVNLGA
jgi:hypothetical protein